MKQVVFVVEGQTEQVFIQNFIGNLVTLLDCHILHQKYHKGELRTVTSRGVEINQACILITIINAEGDDSVSSFIEDRLEGFKKQGVVAVYGLRDRFSGDSKKPKLNIPFIDKYFKRLQNEWGFTIELIVAIEEVEAWFLAVPYFFEKIDEKLTTEKLVEILGEGFFSKSVEEIAHPAAIIAKVFETVGKKYRKRLDDAHAITDALDYNSLYFEKSENIATLKRLVNALNNALTPETSIKGAD